MNEPIFEVWRAVNEAAMAEDVSLIRRLVADAGIQPGVHVGRDPSEFTPVITAEWALGQWADMIDNGSPFLNSARNISISFRRCLANDCRYRVPASWSWSPEPPATVTGDDLRERIAQAIWERDGWGDPWVTAGHLTHTKYRRMADAVLAVLPPQPTPPPAPPWPGAVLSGLVDEDGVPTWLAQAGQVRGEQVRRRSDFVWVNNDQMVAHLDTVWVEVRAPRAVPVPETERVPWWEAVGRRWTDGRTVWKVTHSVEGVIAWDNGGEALDVMFSADGTVEVLKDGGQ